MNGHSFFSFHIKIKRPRVAERGKPALFLGGVGWSGVVSYINRDSLTVHHSG